MIVLFSTNVHCKSEKLKKRYISEKKKTEQNQRNYRIKFKILQTYLTHFLGTAQFQ